MKRALFSVDNIAGIEHFAARLKKMGWHIIGSKETVRELERHNIAVEDIADFTGIEKDYGFPPTLHPKVEAALTLDKSFRIDLLYDVPYPQSKGNDVGGCTLLGLAAKGKRIVAFMPEDMEQVIKELEEDRDHRSVSADLHRELIGKASAYIARHYLTLTPIDRENLLAGRSILRLANGENPYQKPADLFTLDDKDRLSLPQLQPQNANIPCFTNLADTDCILHTLCLAAEAFYLRHKKAPFIAIAAKHGNACGMAIEWDSTEKSVLGALSGNPIAIWGGEFITNFKIDEKLARLLHKSEERKKKFGSAYWMLDIIVAPDFDEEAIEILSKHSSRKLYKNPELYKPGLTDSRWQCRQVRGGFLRQPPSDYILDFTKVESDASGLNDRIRDDLILAWSVAYSSFHGGNEIALAKEGRLLGAGGGPSTLDAAKTALMRAQACGHDTTGSVFAADAFFPFTDAPAVLKEAVSSCGIVPAGGKNEALVRKYFADSDISVVYIKPQYRGFYRH